MNKSTDSPIDSDAETTSTTEQVDRDQYSTGEFVGWPTPADPHARPFAGHTFPDWEVVVLHLQRK